VRIVTRELGRSEYKVSCVGAGDAFLRLGSRALPNVAVVDWELHGVAPGGADDGTVSGETGVDVAARLLTEFGNVPVVFCTKYKQFHPNELLDPRAVAIVLRKPLRASDTVDWVRRELVPAIDHVRGTFGDRSREPLGFPISGSATEKLFRYESRAWAELTGERKSQLRSRAYSELRGQLGAIFAESRAAWAVLARSGERLRVVSWSDRKDDPPPSLDEIRRFERTTNGPVLVVSRPPRVESVDITSPMGPDPEAWVECSYSGIEGDSFPTLTVEYAGQKLSLHFDTGSSHSFLSFERASELGVVTATYDDYAWTYSEMSSRGRTRPYEWTDVRDEVRCPRGISSSDVGVVFQMIRDWSKTPISVVCGMGRCPDSLPTKQGILCGRRRLGLMGRDFLLRNPHVVVVLDGEARITHVVPREQMDQI